MRSSINLARRSLSSSAACRRQTSLLQSSPSKLSSAQAVRTLQTTRILSFPSGTKSSDPLSKEYKYWNREESKKDVYKKYLEISPWSVKREARILSLSDPNDDANAALHDGELPYSSRLLGVGTTVAELQTYEKDKPNVLFVSPSCPKACEVLPRILDAFPAIEWIHVRSAGIDFLTSDELSHVSAKVPPMTNAKGQFSSSLAEYSLMACSYFAKDLPRLMKQKMGKQWSKYDVEELRGKTLGVVGYGDIGRATAKLANAYGMRVVALRRRPHVSANDPLCDKILGTGKAALNELMSESDYVVCSAPSTISTRGMINADAFKAAKEGMVFINLGRGPVVDEEAMIEALKSGRLKGAALDVFSEEPLPEDNDLWELDNVLISPHNMDQTATFMHEATEFFVNENLPRFICGEDLLNHVDIKRGY